MKKKQDDMRKKFNNPKIKFYIGNVRDRESVDAVMKGVDYVFHAAALKQVPSCEFFPIQAVKTNILGSNNVMELAISNNVKKVIILSTDKSVYPINAMGMSKALMELVMVAKAREVNRSGTIFCGTRYGNVMASRGSFIPLFINQIKQGKPLTITDPNMTRFMMTLDDAVDLVLYAFEHGNQGDRFVQKAPTSTIRDFVTISPNSTICSEVIVGDGAIVGAGSTIIEKIKIGENSLIGAGSVVIRDVHPNVVVIGNPARIIRERNYKETYLK